MLSTLSEPKLNQSKPIGGTGVLFTVGELDSFHLSSQLVHWFAA